MSKIKKIVCLGGGNAMPKAVLRGLKNSKVKLSVVCAMLDSGGSAGRLRKDFKIVSPGDIRRALIALSNTSPVIEDLFNYRFQTGEFRGHNFANLFITALELTTGNYEKALEEVSRFLNVKHQVLPVTLESAELYAVLENGKLIKGEVDIDIPRHRGTLRIKKVFLKPQVRAYPKAVKAIKEANIVVIGPGDIYSSLAQILLTRGIPEAIRRSGAKKVYICNLMTKHGETNGFSVSDFTKAIEKMLGQELDYVIYNNKKPSKELLKRFRKEHPELLESVNFSGSEKGKKFIAADLLSPDSLGHDPKKLSKIISKL